MSEIMNQDDQIMIKPGIAIVDSMAEDFKAELVSVINEGHTEVIIDLEGAEMIDSVGVGIVVAAYNTLKQSNRTLKVINVTKDIKHLFSSLQLDRRFIVEPAV